MRAVGVAVQREEVVPVVEDVVAKLLGPNRSVPQRAVVALLGMELGGDSDGAHRVLHVADVHPEP